MRGCKGKRERGCNSESARAGGHKGRGHMGRRVQGWELIG